MSPAVELIVKFDYPTVTHRHSLTPDSDLFKSFCEAQAT